MWVEHAEDLPAEVLAVVREVNSLVGNEVPGTPGELIHAIAAFQIVPEPEAHELFAVVAVVQTLTAVG